MMSLQRAKELLNDPNLSDAEVEQIRDDFRLLAEIMVESWLEKQVKKQPENPPPQDV